ncbi:MAG TPA: hypothetical protein VD963_05140, partial [Phycisphaerales bacterium]|nr:hypothetical protein [Phycisphaerales bacterium]
ALERLRARSEPLVAELPPEPGSRAARYAHLLAGPVAAAERAPRPAPAATGTGPAPTRAPAPAPGRGLEDRVADLEAHVAELRAALESLRGPEGGPGRPGTA